MLPTVWSKTRSRRLFSLSDHCDGSRGCAVAAASISQRERQPVTMLAMTPRRRSPLHTGRRTARTSSLPRSTAHVVCGIPSMTDGRRAQVGGNTASDSAEYTGMVTVHARHAPESRFQQHTIGTITVAP